MSKRWLGWVAALLAGGAGGELTIHAGKLVDSAAGEVLEAVTIRVDGERIADVTPGYVGEPDIDLTDAFVSPGWIDAHVHITMEGGPKLLETLTMTPGEMALRSVPYAERTLLTGFTTVRDLAAINGLSIAMRDAIAAGHIIGPRIFAAGTAIGTTGGHADFTNGFGPALHEEPGPAEGVINGVDDAYRAVRARYKEGADLIKVTATGGVFSQAKSGYNAQFTEAELAAIVAAAADYGLRVAAHAHGAEGMLRAVAAGVHSIEHGTFMNEEVMALMKEKGTWYVPTIMVGIYVAKMAEVEGALPEVVRVKAAAIGPHVQQTFARAYRAGVPIAFGTDSGGSPHGLNWQEFLYMVEAGMPVLEAIQSATKNAAQLLDAWEDLGSIEPGKYADIIALSADPREDVQAFGQVRFVMKGGKVFKQ